MSRHSSYYPFYEADNKRLEEIAGLHSDDLDVLFDSANEAAGEAAQKYCEHCGAPVFWMQTEKGWRLFQSNEDELDSQHTCPEYLEFLRKEREKESPGVVISLSIDQNLGVRKR